MWGDWLREALAWLGRLVADVQTSDIKWTDIAIVVFTFGQMWVGIRQSRISREQTRIAEKTRDIAVTALGQPYVFFEFLSHNLEDWRAGRNRSASPTTAPARPWSNPPTRRRS